MPKVAKTALIWSPEENLYQLYTEQSLFISIQMDSTLQREVRHLSAFAFEGQHGHLTLRKEPRERGEGDWYAYRHHKGQTFNRCLGRLESLSCAALEDIARSLTAEIQTDIDSSSQGLWGMEFPEKQVLSISLE